MAHDHDAHFEDRAVTASYVMNAQNKVPGLADLHRMVMLLLAEQVHGPIHVLVVGAGGGMETRAMAEAQPDWRFTGVDPSSAMLALARHTLEPFAQRTDLIEGTIDQAPSGPFDGATCLLTMHHLDKAERLHLLRETRRRLKSDARLVMVEHSTPDPDATLWLARSFAFGDRAGPDWDKAKASARMMTDHLTLLSPADEEDLLRAAGFENVAMFYAAFSFRGWVATAGSS